MDAVDEHPEQTRNLQYKRRISQLSLFNRVTKDKEYELAKLKAETAKLAIHKFSPNTVSYQNTVKRF